MKKCVSADFAGGRMRNQIPKLVDGRMKKCVTTVSGITQDLVETLKHPSPPLLELNAWGNFTNAAPI
jgi:hypothetical protein